MIFSPVTMIYVFLSVIWTVAAVSTGRTRCGNPYVSYSVYGSEAVYYHATKVCKTQTNGRELTVRDALREGLQPCPNCNPPTIIQ